MNPECSSLQRLGAHVSGTVQGVGFRYSTVQQASRIGGIAGRVKNNLDGSVTVIAEGESSKLALLCVWLKGGPSGASVKNVEARYSAYRGTYRSFGVEF